MSNHYSLFVRGAGSKLPRSHCVFPQSTGAGENRKVALAAAAPMGEAQFFSGWNASHVCAALCGCPLSAGRHSVLLMEGRDCAMDCVLFCSALPRFSCTGSLDLPRA